MTANRNNIPSRQTKRVATPEPALPAGVAPSSLVYGAYCQKPHHKRSGGPFPLKPSQTKEKRAISGPNVLRITAAAEGPDKGGSAVAHALKWLEWGLDPPEDHKTPSAGAKRGSVKGLSKESAARLRELLASLIIPGRLTHVTLTFWRKFPKSRMEVKSVYKCLADWMDNRGLYGLWALHFQSRGAVHFHCLIVGFDEGHEKDLRDYWTRFNPHEEGVFVTAGDTAKASFYLGIHHATEKDQTTWPSWYNGRAWGYFGRKLVLQHQFLEKVGEGFSPLEWVCLKRVYVRFLRSKGLKVRLRAYQTGFRLFIPKHHHGPMLRMCQSWARQIAKDRGGRWEELESRFFDPINLDVDPF